MKNDDLPRDVVAVVSTLCADLATPISLGVFLRLKYKEYGQLATMVISPHDYLSADSYFRDNIAVSYLKKYPELPTKLDLKSDALENFFASERLCCRTNSRLQSLSNGTLAGSSDLACLELIARARKIIGDILGHCPDLLRGRFGPGSTFSDRGKLTTVPDKMSSRPTLTSAALPFLFQWTGTAWASACASAEKPPLVIRGNRFTTVPKDSTKVRGICIEPSINVFYQLGFGQVIRSRLSDVGIHLDLAQEVHKRVACDASIKGHLCTIDLSNASDTVSNSLVRLLLPSRWFECLSALRSPTTLIDGKTVILEKFSSMGNGYTFELETLLFLGIVSAAIEMDGWESNHRTDGVIRRFSDSYVYGDDIIIPTKHAQSALAALRFLGFVPNPKKTFVSGQFRESCGGDYFNGKDVRPYFLKVVPNEPQHFIAMANGVRRLSLEDNRPPSINRIYLRTWFRILDALPCDIKRLRGPSGLGDLVVWDEFDRWNIRWLHSIRYVMTYSPAKFVKISWAHFRPDVVLATALYGTGDGLQGVTPRNAVLGYKKRWVPFS